MEMNKFWDIIIILSYLMIFWAIYSGIKNKDKNSKISKKCTRLIWLSCILKWIIMTSDRSYWDSMVSLVGFFDVMILLGVYFIQYILKLNDKLEGERKKCRIRSQIAE